VQFTTFSAEAAANGYNVRGAKEGGCMAKEANVFCEELMKMDGMS